MQVHIVQETSNQARIFIFIFEWWNTIISTRSATSTWLSEAPINVQVPADNDDRFSKELIVLKARWAKEEKKTEKIESTRTRHVVHEFTRLLAWIYNVDHRVLIEKLLFEYQHWYSWSTSCNFRCRILLILQKITYDCHGARHRHVSLKLRASSNHRYELYIVTHCCNKLRILKRYNNSVLKNIRIFTFFFLHFSPLSFDLKLTFVSSVKFNEIHNRTRVSNVTERNFITFIV